MMGLEFWLRRTGVADGVEVELRLGLELGLGRVGAGIGRVGFWLELGLESG